MENNNKNINDEEEVEIIAEELETEHDLKVLNECWHISLYPKDKYGNVFPSSQINSLEIIGRIERIKTIADWLPPFSEFNPEFCYLGFEIIFRCDRIKSEIENIFRPIRNEFKIRIFPPNSNISDYIDLINELSDVNRRVGEILMEIGALTDFELEEVLSIQKELQEESCEIHARKPLGELLIQENMLQESVVNAALKKQGKVRDKRH